MILRLSEGDCLLIAIFTMNQTNEEIASIIARSHPELSDRLPKVDDLSKINHDLLYSSSKAQEQLGIQFIPLEKCIKDTADKLVQIERELKN